MSSDDDLIALDRAHVWRPYTSSEDHENRSLFVVDRIPNDARLGGRQGLDRETLGRPSSGLRVGNDLHVGGDDLGTFGPRCPADNTVGAAVDRHHHTLFAPS